MRRWPINGSRLTPRDSGPSSSASPAGLPGQPRARPTATTPYALPGRAAPPAAPASRLLPRPLSRHRRGPRRPGAGSRLARHPRATAVSRLAGQLGDRLRAPATFVLRSFGPDDPASLPRELAPLRSSSPSPDARARAPIRGGRGREYRLQERADGTRSSSSASPRAEEAAPRRGELPRSTCRLLAELTEPRSDDVFLDPFCGYGGIALERALAAPYRFVFASDADPEKIAAVKSRPLGRGSSSAGERRSSPRSATPWTRAPSTRASSRRWRPTRPGGSTEAGRERRRRAGAAARLFSSRPPAFSRREAGWSSGRAEPASIPADRGPWFAQRERVRGARIGEEGERPPLRAGRLVAAK